MLVAWNPVPEVKFFEFTNEVSTITLGAQLGINLAADVACRVTKLNSDVLFIVAHIPT